MLPNEYALDQNYPNPFNPSTTIKYQLTQDSKVNLTIYNVQGQVVRTLVNDNVSAGFQSVSWNGKNEMGQTVASGMYMYRIQAGSFVSVKKMLMLK
jgi:flagellar hook assembly protein FlgD